MKYPWNFSSQPWFPSPSTHTPARGVLCIFSELLFKSIISEIVLISFCLLSFPPKKDFQTSFEQKIL